MTRNADIEWFRQPSEFFRCKRNHLIDAGRIGQQHGQPIQPQGIAGCRGHVFEGLQKRSGTGVSLASLGQAGTVFCKYRQRVRPLAARYRQVPPRLRESVITVDDIESGLDFYGCERSILRVWQETSYIRLPYSPTAG